MPDCEINRTDYLILMTLYASKCTNFYHSMTITEIIEDNSDDNGNNPLGARMTVYRKLQRLVEIGYIKKGIKDDHADTFYIDAPGISLIENGGMRV